ncbi:MAG: sigma-70 family RNA polymerase sigma factor [Pirellulales bacterium]
MPLSNNDRPLQSGWETLFEPDREWLLTQPFSDSQAKTTSPASLWKSAKGVLAKRLEQWIAERGEELLNQPVIAEMGEAYYELARKLWECWKYHWMAECKVTDGGKVDGMWVAQRIRNGRGLGSGTLGGDVIHDLVWADGVLRGDPRATRIFLECFEDFAVAVARRTSPRYAQKLDWWDDLKATLVVREKHGGKLANYQGHSGLKSWLGRMFVREIMHYAERERREATAVEGFPGVADAKAVAADLSATERDCRDKVRLALRDSLDLLEPEPRQALLHHFVDDLENQEAARIMGVAPGTATRRRDRGLSELRDLLLARIKHEGNSLSGCLKHLLRLGDDLDLTTLLLAKEHAPRHAAGAGEERGARSAGKRSPGGRP